MPTIDEILRDEVTNQFDGSFKKGQAVKLKERENLDPFGILNTSSGQQLGAYDFASLTPKQAQSFFTSMDLRGTDTVPTVDSIAPDKLAEKDTGVHQDIPRLQHSIWVGQPLNGDSPKKKAFMDQLAKTKAQNREWDVVLWTDQPRERFHKKPLDPDIVEMEKWARENGIRLANIDEVFGAPENRMQLHTERRLEQNKGGTGRAVVSDVTRLEILNRFGGIYVDGDKPFKKKLDEIADQAATSKIKIKGQGPEISGFVSARQGDNPQNCALCCKKDSPVTQSILQHIKDEYSKDRSQMKPKSGGDMTMVGRAQRMEVIARSGPSSIEAITQREGLMDKDSLQSYTGTTSWSQEETYVGYKVPTRSSDLSVTGVPRMSSQTEVDTLKNNTATLPSLPPTDGLALDRQQAIGKAVRGGLTALCYTTTNEMGRMDLKHLEPHFAGLSPTEKQIALHTTLKALETTEFKGLRDSVTSFAVPSSMGITKESMDVLTNKTNFPKLKLDDYAVQRAALRGDLAFLQYCKTKNVPFTSLSQAFDAGTLSPTFFSSNYTPLRAAMHGNQVEVVKFLMANSHEGGFNQAEMDEQGECLKQALARGQTENATVIMEIAAQKIGTIPDGPTRQKHMAALNKKFAEGLNLMNNVDGDDFKRRFPKTPAQSGLEDLENSGIPGLDDLKNNTGALEGLGDPELRQKLVDAGIGDPEIDSLTNLGTGNLKAGMKRALSQGELDKTAREGLMKDVVEKTTPNLLERMKQVPALKDAVSIGAAQGMNDAIRRKDLAALKELEDGDFSPELATPEYKKILVNTIARNTALFGGGKETLDKAEELGLKDDVYEAALSQRNMAIVTAKLNETRALDKQVAPGTYDLEADITIVQAASPSLKKEIAESFVQDQQNLGGAAAVLTRAENIGLKDEVIQAAVSQRNMAVITANLNKTRALDKQVVPGTYDLEADQAIVAASTPEQKKAFAEYLVQNQGTLGGAGAVLTRAENIGLKDQVLETGLKNSDMGLISTHLNEGRTGIEKVTPGHYDGEAMTQIAKAKFGDTETIKNDHSKANLTTMTKEQARELALKGLSYASHRADQGYTGRASRMTEWRDLMAEIQKKFPDDVGLNHLVGQADGALKHLQDNKQSVKTTLLRQTDGSSKHGTGGAGSVAAALGKRPSVKPPTHGTGVHHGGL